MILNRVSKDKKGIATMLLLIIIIVIVAVVAVGAFVALSGNDGGNDGGGDTKVTGVKIGVGSELNYDLTGSSKYGSMKCQVAGEDATYLYIVFPDIMDASTNPTPGFKVNYTMRINKETGDLGWATADGADKWKTVIGVLNFDADFVNINVDVEMGSYNFGTIMKKITFSATGKSTVNATLNVSKCNILTPTDYVAPAKAGKYATFEGENLTTPKSVVGEIRNTYTIRSTIVGNGVGGALLVMSEMTSTITKSGTSSDGTFTVVSRDLVLSTSGYDIPNMDLSTTSWTNEGPGTVTMGTTTVNVTGYSLISDDGTFYGEYLKLIGISKPILYYAESYEETSVVEMEKAIACTFENL